MRSRTWSEHGGALKRCLAAGLACVLLQLGMADARSADRADIRDKLVELGSGPPGGAFRPVGESLCDVVNADRRKTHVRCVAIGTSGSHFNLESVMSGRLLMGLAHEGLVHRLRQDPKRTGAQALRVVAYTHASHITVMAGPQSGITDLRQLAGKRVNMGARGSDQFAITQALLAALSLDAEQLGETSDLPTSEIEASLCGNQVDVVVDAAHHPSPQFQRLLACGGRFIDIPADVMASMRAADRWLLPMQIAANSYEGQPTPVASLGMRNVLVTQGGVEAETVFRLTHALVQRHPEFRREHPMLATMPGPALIQPEGLPAPLHDGAARAYGLQRKVVGSP